MAPPNSALVSEIAEAAPARSGGAEPTMRPVVVKTTGTKPRPINMLANSTP
ncbi:hypothetical protein D3C87_2065410 [compost metagenome]